MLTSLDSARPALTVVLALLVPFIGAPPARASWIAQGNPVCTSAGAQVAPSAVADGTGGMIAAWLDSRPGAPGIYAQRLLGDGSIAPGWPVDGALCSGATASGVPVPVPDGAGGALILWLGTPSIYAQRIEANGSMPAGWPAGGKLITSDLSTGSGFAAVTDGAGGAYFTRIKFNFLTFWNSILLTRITSDGNFAAGWTEPGVTLANSEQVTLFGMNPDPTGGVVCAVGYYVDVQVDSRWGNIRRVRPDGTNAFISNCTAHYSSNAAPGGITHVAAAPDGAGGAYGTWHDFNSMGAVHGDFGMHLGPTGVKLWTEPYPVGFSASVIEDGLVGVWLAGRPSGTSLQVHRRLANGALPAGWTGAGVVVASAASLPSFSAVPLATELALCWPDKGAGGDHDIRVLSVAHW